MTFLTGAYLASSCRSNGGGWPAQPGRDFERDLVAHGGGQLVPVDPGGRHDRFSDYLTGLSGRVCGINPPKFISSRTLDLKISKLSAWQHSV
jgi:hypothetical protein